MTEQPHPSLDELADLREDLLDPPRGDEVTAHVHGCPACAETLADLDGVSAVLASVGSERPTMPPEVTASVQAALARARVEDAAGVPSLAERRAADVPSRRRGLATRIILLGAAATVVGVVGVNLNSLSGSDESDSAGSGAADRAAQRSSPEIAAGGAGSGTEDSAQPGASAPTSVTTTKRAAAVASNEVAGRARALVKGQVKTGFLVPATGRCADVAAEVVGKQMLSTVVRFTGQRAVLVADLAPREARIYSCASAELIFSTPF